jgi:hypothetical protein
MLSPIFEKFVEKSPVSVIARGMMERVLNPEQLDQWFDKTAQEQYTKDLLFSTVFCPRRQLQITTDDNYKCTFYIANPPYRATSRGRE